MARLEDLSRPARATLVGAVTFVLCLALVVVAELGVRVRQGIENTFSFDATIGMRVPVAGLAQDGIEINSLGFRSPELAVPKPRDTVRIVFIGASTTYSGEVTDNAHTWPHLVTEAIREAYPDVEFDFVNAGVPGFTVKTSLRNLELRVAPLDPDIAVIYHATNDLSINSEALATASGLDVPRGDSALSWPAEYSKLWYLVEKNLRIRARQRAAASGAQKLRVDRAEIAKPFAQDLAALLDASTKEADLVVVATFSHRQRAEQSPEQQASAAVTSLYYMPYMSLEGLLEGFAAYNDAIRRAAETFDVMLVDGEFDIPGDARHFTDSVHFTDAGARAMADRVIKSLVQSEQLAELLASRTGNCA